MKYIRTALWVIGLSLACYAQYNYAKHIDIEAQRHRDKIASDSLAKSVESFPDHSEITNETLKH